VAALDCQFDPALAIFDPGSACGMPYAPVLGLLAVTLQPLSAVHNGCRQENWLEDHPNEGSMVTAMFCAELDAAGAALAARWLASCWLAGRWAAARCAAASRAAACEAVSLAAALCRAAFTAAASLAAAACRASIIATA
jgi:hypothetical protein